MLDFDADADETAVFGAVMPQHYSATTGVTVYLYWMATTATSGTVRWDVSFKRHADDTVDLDTASFAAVQSVTATAASASGEVTVESIAFTAGAQMDSVVAGDSFQLKVNRDADNGSSLDTMLNDAELLRVEVRET